MQQQQSLSSPLLLSPLVLSLSSLQRRGRGGGSSAASSISTIPATIHATPDNAIIVTYETVADTSKHVDVFYTYFAEGDNGGTDGTVDDDDREPIERGNVHGTRQRRNERRLTRRSATSIMLSLDEIRAKAQRDRDESRVEVM